MSRFVDWFAVWLTITLSTWFAAWVVLPSAASWYDVGYILGHSAMAATALTLIMWGIYRVTRPGSTIPRRFMDFINVMDPTKKKEGSDDGSGK